MNKNLYQIKSVMIGHAIGDALGVPVEFCEREELDENPVIKMMGFGSYPVPAGAWSDDTSMAIATLDSLAKGVVDYDDIMKNFVSWTSEDAYTPTGEMFDIGRTCLAAIRNYLAPNGRPALECGLNDERSNGNGSLMRIHPFALYEFFNESFNINTIHSASSLTHAHRRSQIACGIYSFVLWELLKSHSKESIRYGLNKARRFYGDDVENQHYNNLYRRIGLVDIHFEDPDTFQYVERKDIKSSGYVVDTLEAALWCVLTTNNYSDCVLKAVNLGDDTDTVAAVAGGLAGALYGYDDIPKEWLDTLIKRDHIENMCETACRNWFGDVE